MYLIYQGKSYFSSTHSFYIDYPVFQNNAYCQEQPELNNRMIGLTYTQGPHMTTHTIFSVCRNVAMNAALPI
jgi:hypothetical protein